MSDPALFGLDLFGNPNDPPARGIVASRYIEPPFSVFDARSGDWQERKRAWISLGIKSEVGRDSDLTYRGTAAFFDHYRVAEGARVSSAVQGTSVFDPVLCELVLRWFCPAGGQVIDPFAGGSVRGIVAGALGRPYWGCDLSAEQVAANAAQADAICPAVRPTWVVGDSLDTLGSAPHADFVFSCPPYGDLERYSDDPKDLSTMEWHTFVAAYKRIILRAVLRLNPESFACFVVGNFRDSRGFYRDLVGTTVAAFEEVGAHFYNEAVLVTPVGTASLRVTKQFESGRKLCKIHQNILVFCKGSWKLAARRCSDGAATAGTSWPEDPAATAGVLLDEHAPGPEDEDEEEERGDPPEPPHEVDEPPPPDDEAPPRDEEEQQPGDEKHLLATVRLVLERARLKVAGIPDASLHGALYEACNHYEPNAELARDLYDDVSARCRLASVAETLDRALADLRP